MTENVVDQIIKIHASERGASTVQTMLRQSHYSPLELAEQVSHEGNIQLVFDTLFLADGDDVVKASIISSAFFHALVKQRRLTDIYSRFSLPWVQVKSLLKEETLEDGYREFRDLAQALSKNPARSGIS